MKPLFENHEELSREDILQTPIEECELPKRAKKVLLTPDVYLRNGHEAWYRAAEERQVLLKPVLTVGELLELTRMQVLYRPGCGRKTLHQIINGLRVMGLKLKDMD